MAHDSTGTLYIRELALPPSELWSAEYRDYHVRLLTDLTSDPTFPVPAREASQAEWDKFDAWKRVRNHDRPLVRAHERYPVEVEESELGGVRVATVMPAGGVASENVDRVLINLHGGGFVYNRGLSVGQLESIPVAALGRVRIVTLDYRQAPFHRYPAASEDVEAVYRALLQNHAPGAIGIFGCSAGGVLAAQAVARFQSRGLPRPGAIGVLSIGLPPPCVPPPWQRGWGDSAVWFSSPAPANQLSELDRVSWEPACWYMEGVDGNDPEAYPGSSDDVLRGFPPTLFLSGTRDFSLSSVATSHARLLKLGVDSALYVIEGALHSAHVFAVGTPEAHDAQAYIARWFGEWLAH